MRIRILVQVGAFTKEKSNPQADFLKLLQTPDEIFKWAYEQLQNYPFELKKLYQIADGCTHLMEFEAIKEIP